MSYQREAKKLYRMRKDTEAQEAVLVSVLDAELKRGDAVELADRLGISTRFLSDCRKGRRRFGAALLRELGEA